MKVLPAVLVVALALATLSTGSVLATSCGTSTFEEQIGRAKLIFVGTATNDTSVWVPCPGTTDTCTIVTKYQFDQVSYLKGQGPADSLILAQVGGIVGDEGIYREGGVTFEPGSRYVVLAGKSYYLPDHYETGPCTLGPFAVRPDSSNAGALVNLLFPHQDPGTRVSEEDILKALASVIRRVEEATEKK